MTSQRFISSYPEKPQLGDWEGMKHGSLTMMVVAWLQQLTALSRRYASSPALDGTMR